MISFQVRFILLYFVAKISTVIVFSRAAQYFALLGIMVFHSLQLTASLFLTNSLVLSQTHIHTLSLLSLVFDFILSFSPTPPQFLDQNLQWYFNGDKLPIVVD